jgi:tetratricopeptide (TPR) repeat protein
MILTQCAVCATDLGLTLGKKCGRCTTRYCGPECQKQHWEGGGHDKLCKLIKKAGGAEQYNANEMYAAHVTVAAEACAEDTKGQTCYICTEAVHRHTGEGLVRGCACHTTEGFVHVSCLAEQAKILVAEAEENNLGRKVLNERWARWTTCSLCEQNYYGVVRCALGWACWKTYVGRPEADWVRLGATQVLGNGLYRAKHHEDALTVQEAELSMARRIGASERDILITQSNIAGTYQQLGQFERALQLKRDVYFGLLRLKGEENSDTVNEAYNLADCLCGLDRLDEAKLLLRKTIPVARRVRGESDETTLRMRGTYARTLYMDTRSTLDDLREAADTLVDVERIARRVFGGDHPFTKKTEAILRTVRGALETIRTP